MPLACGYTFTDDEMDAVRDVWRAWEADPCGVAVCTAPMSVAHRHAVVIGACGGFSRVRVESSPGAVAAFVQRFDADPQRGMFALDRDGAPLDEGATRPFFTARHLDDPDLVVLALEPSLFAPAHLNFRVNLRRLVATKPVLLLCWWYPAVDDMLRVALHDVFGTKNIFSPPAHRVPKLCESCTVTRVHCGGDAAADARILPPSTVLCATIKTALRESGAKPFDTVFSLLKQVRITFSCAARSLATLHAAASAEDGHVVYVCEFQQLHDNLQRSLRNQQRLSFTVLTKQHILEAKYPPTGVPDGPCQVVVADAFFVDRELEMCVHLLNARFTVTSVKVFTWTRDSDKFTSQEWALAPSKDAVISALKCFIA